MSIILKSMSGYLGPLLLCLERRLSQLYEGIEIINGILPCCQSISAHVWRNPVILYCTAISNTALILG